MEGFAATLEKKRTGGTIDYARPSDALEADHDGTVSEGGGDPVALHQSDGRLQVDVLGVRVAGVGGVGGRRRRQQPIGRALRVRPAHLRTAAVFSTSTVNV